MRPARGLPYFKTQEEASNLENRSDTQARSRSEFCPSTDQSNQIGIAAMPVGRVSESQVAVRKFELSHVVSFSSRRSTGCRTTFIGFRHCLRWVVANRRRRNDNEHVREPRNPSGSLVFRWLCMEIWHELRIENIINSRHNRSQPRWYKH